MNKNNVGLSSPWAIYYRQLEALFMKDPQVKVIFDADIPEVQIRVEGEEKAEAISKLLPITKDFGAVTLNIKVIPANMLEESRIALFQKAFEGNEGFSRIEIVDNEFLSNPINFVVFKKEVVQYFNDDIGDLHGVCSTLYQDIAKDIFGQAEGIFFCTEVEE